MHLFYFLYIDPGIGSLAAQVILAGIAAFFMFFKNGLRRFFNRSETDSNKSDKDNEKNSD